MVIKGTRPRSEVIGLVIFFGIHCIVSLYHCISAAYIKDITIGQMSLVTVVTSSEWFYKLAFKVRFILTQEQLSLNPGLLVRHNSNSEQPLKKPKIGAKSEQNQSKIGAKSEFSS